MTRFNRKALSVSRKGFTLIELLVVIAIISLIISILLPSLQHAKEMARETVCVSNTRNIGVIMQYYAQDNNYHLPVPEDQFGSYSRFRYWSVALAVYITEDESALDIDGEMITLTQPESVVQRFQCPTLLEAHPTERSTYVMNNYRLGDPDSFSQGLNLQVVEDPYCRVAVGEGAFCTSYFGARYDTKFFNINHLGFYHNGGEITGTWGFFGTKYEQTDGRGTLLMVDGHTVSAKPSEVAAMPGSEGDAAYFTTPY